MENTFTVTLHGVPMDLPYAGTTISTTALPPPRTWVKLSVQGRIVAAYLVDQAYDEAVRRRDRARTY